MADLNKLASANLRRWAAAKMTRSTLAGTVAKRLVDAKARYKAVEARTGVPWYVVAVIHQRESSQSWTRSLAQGDPWNRKSVNVPRGRGPFKSWEEAADDALVNCHPFLARRKDWSLGGTLVALEAYNGVGYANKGVPSPYLWAGTDQYRAGKYVSDGKYDPNHVDQQLGCVAMLRAMAAIDPSIDFKAPPTPEKPVVASKPSKAPVKAAGSIAATAAVGAAAHAGVNPLFIVGAVAAVAVIAFLVWRLRK